MRGTIGKSHKMERAEYNIVLSHCHVPLPEYVAGTTGRNHRKHILIFQCVRVGTFFLSLPFPPCMRHKTDTFSKFQASHLKSASASCSHISLFPSKSEVSGGKCSPLTEPSRVPDYSSFLVRLSQDVYNPAVLPWVQPNCLLLLLTLLICSVLRM